MSRERKKKERNKGEELTDNTPIDLLDVLKTTDVHQDIEIRQ